MRFKLTLFALLLLLGSCVSQRKYNDMYALWVYADGQYREIKNQNRVNDNTLQMLRAEIARLRKDSAYIDSVCQQYMNASEADRKKLKLELQAQAAQLQLQSSRLTLSAAKIAELEAILFRKDSIMKVTRERLSNALLGFKDKGVHVHIVGGKVYISLDERLLFQSGKTDVNPMGKTALQEIATALNMDTTTVLTVEGHTDDVPYKGKVYKDNWDISVLRATSVVRFMQKQGNVAPDRFIASGRAEYLPIDPAKTPEARKKNRRIEIIVTPNLDEIARLLESN